MTLRLLPDGFEISPVPRESLLTAARLGAYTARNYGWDLKVGIGVHSGGSRASR